MSESHQTNELIISVPSLAAFDAANLQATRKAFRKAPALEFQQFWLGGQEQEFSDGTVRIGRRGNTLCVFAELTDTDIFSTSTRDHERLWELGDVFEIFVKSKDSEVVFEFQMNPNHHKLCLRFDNFEEVIKARQMDDFNDHFFSERAFRFTVWQPVLDLWVAYAEIPCDLPGFAIGHEWSVCFGRYDYTRGRPAPTISATARLTQVDFHRRSEWHQLRFQIEQ